MQILVPVERCLDEWVPVSFVSHAVHSFTQQLVEVPHKETEQFASKMEGRGKR